jgi:glucosylceramidase
MDGNQFYENLNKTHHLQPNKFLLGTESCHCPGVGHGAEAWFRAQRYAHDIINDLNNWAVGWVDWNLILDHVGGPNHLGNLCDSPMILNEEENDVHLQPMYHFISHISRFAVPGSVRLHSEVRVTFSKPGNATLFDGYPGRVWHCDQSSRQRFVLTKDLRLQVEGSNFCVTDVDGTNVQFWECWETNTQRWIVRNKKIQNLTTKKCMGVADQSELDGTKLTMYDCNDETQVTDWHLEGKLLRDFVTLRPDVGLISTSDIR